MSKKYGRTDFELDDSSDAIPNKYVLVIYSLDDMGDCDEEIAVVVHRATTAYPYGCKEMREKENNADLIVNALNNY